MWKTLKASFDSPDSYVSLALGLAVVLVVGMIAFNYFKAKMQTSKTTAEQKQEQAAKVALPTKYAVKEGDTLWAIAESYYKSGYNWVDIQQANGLENADYIQVGQVLTIPDVKPITVTMGQISAASTQQGAPRTYTIQPGDCLWSISIAIYGTGYRWPEVAKLNNLANPDLIFAGTVLTLP